MSTSQKCAGCNNPLPKREFLRCMLCRATYDIECANISPKFFNLMELKQQWKCPECLSKRPKTGNVNTPIRNTTSTASVSTDHESASLATPDGLEMDCSNVTHRSKSKRLVAHSNSARPIMDSHDGSRDHSPEKVILSELKLYMRDLIQSQTDSIRESISDLFNAIQAQNTRIERLEVRVHELESKKEEKHPQDLSVLENQIIQLQAEIADRDQALLSNDVEIAGCPEITTENCTHLVLAIAKKVGVELDEKDIVSAERAGPPRPAREGGAPARPRPVAVRLTRREPRDALLRAARVRRNLNTEGLQLPGPATSIFVNERLGKHNRRVFQEARELARELLFKFVWTRDGKIFVRQDHGMARHRLRSDTDLLRVFGKRNIRSQ